MLQLLSSYRSLINIYQLIKLSLSLFEVTHLHYIEKWHKEMKNYQVAVHLCVIPSGCYNIRNFWSKVESYALLI